MPQNAAQNTQNFLGEHAPQTLLEWTATGRPCSLLQLMTLPPQWSNLQWWILYEGLQSFLILYLQQFEVPAGISLQHCQSVLPFDALYPWEWTLQEIWADLLAKRGPEEGRMQYFWLITHHSISPLPNQSVSCTSWWLPRKDSTRALCVREWSNPLLSFAAILICNDAISNCLSLR